MPDPQTVPAADGGVVPVQIHDAAEVGDCNAVAVQAPAPANGNEVNGAAIAAAAPENANAADMAAPAAAAQGGVASGQDIGAAAQGAAVTEPEEKPLDFAKSGFVVTRREDKDLPTVSIAVADVDPSAELLEFKNAVELTEWIIRSLRKTRSKNASNAELVTYIDRLVLIAKAGLEAETPSKAAWSALRDLQKYIEYVEGPGVKNKYMINLGQWAAGSFVAGFMVYFIISPYLIDAETDYSKLLLVWSGTMMGAWLSFGIRNIKIPFENLGGLEADLMTPPVRLVFTGLLSLVLTALFVVQIVTFKIGTLDTTAILSSVQVALVVGLFCGIGEQALPSTLGRRATQFFNQVDGDTKKAGGSVQ
ncbi:hypothetical protein [Rhizobium sp. SGZ-381]|uniref:hypothetical protein n=1 Tax=Rhizobium sp. SGZ-381 TaxID=3342800 RepID=UPI00366EB4BB